MSSRQSDLPARTGMKIAVRGGGHSWVGFALRDDSLLIDLGQPQRKSRLTGPRARRRFSRRSRGRASQPSVGCAGAGLSRRPLPNGVPERLFAERRSGLELQQLEAGLLQRRQPLNVVTADGSLVVANQAATRRPALGDPRGGTGLLWQSSRNTSSSCIRRRARSRRATTITRCRASPRSGRGPRVLPDRLPREVELTIFFAPAPPNPRRALQVE